MQMAKKFILLNLDDFFIYVLHCRKFQTSSNSLNSELAKFLY